jgi:hypothetical protein
MADVLIKWLIAFFLVVLAFGILKRRSLTGKVWNGYRYLVIIALVLQLIVLLQFPVTVMFCDPSMFFREMSMLPNGPAIALTAILMLLGSFLGLYSLLPMFSWRKLPFGNVAFCALLPASIFSFVTMVGLTLPAVSYAVGTLIVCMMAFYCNSHFNCPKNI